MLLSSLPFNERVLGLDQLVGSRLVALTAAILQRNKCNDVKSTEFSEKSFFSSHKSNLHLLFEKGVNLNDESSPPRNPVVTGTSTLLLLPLLNHKIPMSTSGGLSRRRVGGGGGGTTSSYNDDDDDKLHASSAGGGSRSSSPPPLLAAHHAHAGSAFEGGNKIAFDPRDIQQDASEEAKTGGKMPRLTIMEEVLLLGIKDKQVPFFFVFCFRYVYSSRPTHSHTHVQFCVAT